MASEWKTVRLGDLTTWASGGTPPKANPIFWNGDIPWISASSMKTPLLCNSDLKITKEGLENGSRLAETNSVLLLVRGSELHKRIPIGIATRPVAFNQDVKALNVCGEMRSDYLFYWLLGNETMLLGKVEHTGIGAGKLDTQVLKNLPFALPPLAEQKAIASILGALDDKIELNRRMNATLEAMARALFQSWFVDFDPVRAKLDGRKPEGMDKATSALFPDAFQESPIGHVPTGWLVGSLADIMDIQGGTQPPASEFLSEATDGYVRLVQIRDYESESHLTFVRDNSKLRKCYRDDVMIARYGASVARVCWGLEGAYNVALVKAAPHKACYREFLRSYLQAHDFQARLIGMSNRSVQAGFNKGDIASFQIAIAPDDVLEKYQTSAWELRKRILHNKDESRTLATLRDTLLPKLLSGELSVASIPKVTK